MAITPPYNDIEMKTAWAEDAATTIPSVPVPGVSYRNTGISEETIAQGQQYDNIGRSADWNQLLYKISANIVTMQKQGAGLLWVSGRTYEQGSLVKDPDNAQIYYRLKAGAGTKKPASDSTNWQLLQDLFCGEGLILNNNNKLSWGAPIGAASTNCNALTEAGVYWIAQNATNKPTDVESSASNGILVVTHGGASLLQVYYEVNSTNQFSMNTRVSTNNGTSWTAWARFGVEFTLDWRSSGDYRTGDLVRDTRNSLLYVCTNAINNSTQRPGLDSTHFTLLQSYLVGSGLSVIEDKIRWGYGGASLTDANFAISPGVFYCPISCANIPFDDAGILIVYKNGTSTTTQGFSYVQVFNSINGNVPYIAYRISSSSSESSVTWNKWCTLSNFDSLDFVSGQTYNQGQLARGSNNVHYVKKTAASVCTTEPNADSTNFETLAQNIIDQGLLVIGNKINWGNCMAVASPDANELLNPGVYYVDTLAENLPIANRGFIIAVKSSNNSSATTMQCYFSCSTTGRNQTFYVRTYTPSTNWAIWTKIGPAEEVSASDLAGNGLTAANNKLNWGTASAVTNANNVTTPGTYELTSSSTNTPTTNGIMFVVKKTDGTVSQVIFDADTGNTYQRDNASGTWSSWRNQSYNVGATAAHGSTFAFGATHTAPSDGWIRCAAYSNWRANTNGILYINGTGIAANHTGQYGSGGQSSGVETFMFIKAGDTFKCDQGSIEQLAFYAVE